jgi:hypothetical protein
MKTEKEIKEKECCHFPTMGHCWHCEKCQDTPQHLYTCPIFKGDIPLTIARFIKKEKDEK